MSQHPQERGTKGSLKWIQKLINEKPDLLNSRIRSVFGIGKSEEIEWVSPRKNAEYAEYRDSAFLKQLGITLTKKPLKEFWPRWGPQGETFDFWGRP